MSSTRQKLMFVIAVCSVLILAFGGVKQADAAEMKIGYVNLSKTFDEYKKTQDYEKKLGTKGENKEKEREKLVDEIKGLKDEMVLLSENGKQEKQSLIDDKIKNLQEFDRETGDQLRQERDEMIRDILQEINTVIQDYGKKNSYTAILNDRVVIYGSDSIDITQEMIDILNK